MHVLLGELGQRMGSSHINDEMKVAASHALAELTKEDVPDSVLRAYGLESLKFGVDYIIPKPFDPRVLLWEAPAVAEAAMKTGVARRNVDMLVLCVNNFNYGMTGGQMGPTTPDSAITVTSPDGNIEHPFDISNLACALGANYVARWGVSHPYQPIKSVKEGLEKRGFSLLEFLAPCPTAYGRRNKLGDIKKHWAWYDNNTILKEDYEKIMKYGSEKEKEQVKDKIQLGVFQDIKKSGFFEAYDKLVDRLKEKETKSKGAKK